MKDTERTYSAMFKFLDEIWRENKEVFVDDLPGFLGSMRLLNDDSSADPAILGEWNDLVEENEESDGYEHMKLFLDEYSSLTNSKEIPILLEWLNSEEEQLRPRWETIFRSIE